MLLGLPVASVQLHLDLDRIGFGLRGDLEAELIQTATSVAAFPIRTVKAVLLNVMWYTTQNLHKTTCFSEVANKVSTPRRRGSV